MTMSGLFERIARRRATPPEETQELDAPDLAGSASSGDEPAPTETLADGDAVAPAPGEPSAGGQGAVIGEAPTAPTTEQPAAADDAAPTTEQPAAADDAAATTEQPAAADDAAPTTEQPAAAAEAADEPALADARPSFIQRGRVRRRLRYLRRLRELQLRDVGGLVFELRRFGRQREDLLGEKLTQLAATDEELRSLETALDDRRGVTELREPGIGGACQNCGSLHGSADRYCAHCGRPLDPAAANGSSEAPIGEAASAPPPPTS
jgi:hypothetical protein